MQPADFQYSMLEDFMKNLCDRFGISIHVWGSWEYSEQNNRLLHFLSGYVFHLNPYCLYVKSNPTLWSRCVTSKQHILKKLEQAGGPCAGVCHCGVAEWLPPIYCQGAVAGYISAGGFRPDARILKKRMHAMARRYGSDEKALQRAYDENIPDQPEPSPELKAALGTLSMLFSSLADDLQLWDARHAGVRTQQHLLMQQVTEYLHLRYSRDFSMDALAAFCGCSKSSIQHLFKQYCGVSVLTYIENLRMEKACILLKNGELSVGQIAARVGYRDPNYFSLVFTKKHGMSPSAFRRKEQRKSENEENGG